MDGEGETFVTAGGPPPPEPGSSLSGGTWAAVALVGAVLFLLGIWVPAWHGVPGAGTLNLLVAAAGGVLVLVGATYAWQAYQRGRPTPVEQMPGVEVYRPPRVGLTPPSEIGPDEGPR